MPKIFRLLLTMLLLLSTFNCEGQPKCSVTTRPQNTKLVEQGNGIEITAEVEGLGEATISVMKFGSYNTEVAVVTPPESSTLPYVTTVYPVSAGLSAIWATATLSDGRICESTGETDTDVVVVSN